MSNILRRGRLSSSPDEDILNFSSSMSADTWIFEADVLVDMAHTVMLEEQGIISTEDCSRILRGLLTIRREGIGMLDHSYEDIHISLESRLIDMVGEETGGRMHSGRSRNDEIATCIRIRLRDEMLSLMEELESLCTALLNRASVHTETLMPGFTHLQHAQPTTFAHHLLAHIGVLRRDLDRVIGAFSRINKSPLGAAAFASTGFDIDRERTATLLGFSGLVENSMDAVSSRDFLIETTSVLANLMINLSRMAEELVLWSTPEFGFVELHDSYASTSSIMPQKKNPDTAELIRGKAGTVTGSLMALLTICKALPLSYNRDLQEATPNAWRSVESTRSAVRIMTGIIGSMKVNTDNMAKRASEGFTTATELADTMVRVTGIPFRTAHQIVGVLARSREEPSMEDIDVISIKVLGKGLSEMGMTAEMLRDALDPISNIKRRTKIGGPAPEETRRAIDKTLLELELVRSDVKRMNDAIEVSLNGLSDIVNTYTE